MWLRCATRGPGNSSSHWWCRTCDEDHSALGGLLLCCECTVLPGGAFHDLSSKNLGPLSGRPSFFYRHSNLDFKNEPMWCSFIGIVKAPDETSALKAAIKEFGIIKSLLVVIGADVVTVLPTAMRAVWKSERLRGKNHSYREGDTHKQHFHS